MPMDRSKYPPNWEEIAFEVKSAAGWRCEWCDKPCRQPGESWAETVGRILAGGELNWYYQTSDDTPTGSVERPQRFTLTTAHYDHNPANCDRANLVALCATCHTQLDIHPGSLEAKARYKAEEGGQLNLLNSLGWNPAPAPARTKAIGPPPWHPARSTWDLSSMQTTGTTIASREKDPEPLQGEGLEAGKISSSGGVCSHDRPSNPLLDEGPIMDESRIKRIEAEAQVLLKIASRVMRGDVPVECKRHVGNRWLKEREALLDQLGQSGGAA